MRTNPETTETLWDRCASTREPSVPLEFLLSDTHTKNESTRALRAVQRRADRNKKMPLSPLPLNFFGNDAHRLRAPILNWNFFSERHTKNESTREAPHAVARRADRNKKKRLSPLPLNFFGNDAHRLRAPSLNWNFFSERHTKNESTRDAPRAV